MQITVYETKRERIREICITPENSEGKCLIWDPETDIITYDRPEAVTRWVNGEAGRYLETVYFELDVEKYNLIRSWIRQKVESYGVVAESTEKVIRIENSRDVWAPKPIDTILDHVIDEVAGMYRRNCRYFGYGQWNFSMKRLHDYIFSLDKRKVLTKKCLCPAYNDFVLSVGRPVFRRAEGNNKKNTFDFIDLEMVIRSTDVDKKKVVANKQEIFDKAIDKIQGSKQFQKYGIPVNFLHMYQFVLRHDGSLMISFDLKPIKGEF